MDNEISNRIKEAIQSSGYTLYELQDKTKISKSAIQRYASGNTSKIPIEAVKKIAFATGVSPAYIMGWSDQKYVFSQNLTYLMVLKRISIESLSSDLCIDINRIKDLLYSCDDPTLEEVKLVSEYFGIDRTAIIGQNLTSFKYHSDEYGNDNMSKLDQVENDLNYAIREIVGLSDGLNVDGLNKVIEYIEDLSDKYRKND